VCVRLKGARGFGHRFGGAAPLHVIGRVETA
jgi:hypothetical protein